MNIVSIGFSRPHKWWFKPFAMIIMLVSGNFSHTFTSWKCTNIQMRKVFEAVGSGVRILSNVIFKKKAYVVEIYQFEVPDHVINWLDRYSHEQAGKPYSRLHILGLAYVTIMEFFGKDVPNPFKDGSYSHVCVESGAYVLQEIGVKLPKNVEDLTLRQFRDLVAKHGRKAPQEKLDRINGKSR